MCERWGMNQTLKITHHHLSLHHISSVLSPDSLFKGKNQQSGLEIKKSFKLESKECLESLFDLS